MLRLRALVSVVTYAGWTIVMYLGVCVGLLFVGHAPRVRIAWRNRCFRRWSMGVLAIMQIRIDVVGTPPAKRFI